MTALADAIAGIVRRDGPIRIDRYWNLALFDPEHGYYATRDPFGRSGDFVTAPEVSQMFGELLGAWMLAAWRSLGCPAPFVFAEIGPGRGTLMADMLRTVGRLDGGFMKAARVALVETSPRLARLQAERLAFLDLPIRHLRRLEETSEAPLLVVANELFDAVAIRQFVAGADGWRERLVGIGNDNKLRFVLSPPLRPGGGFPPAGWPMPETGAVLELSPEREAMAARVAGSLARCGGAALFIDYGHRASGYGDTLQAVARQAFADPLHDPGAADITSHVDFARLARPFERLGLTVAPLMEQGEFLDRLGLRERAGALGRNRPADDQASIAAAARRLAGCGPGEMGSLFKVLAAASLPLPLPPFTAPTSD